MAPSIIRQFHYESEDWKRMLTFFQEENIFFKHRLAEYLYEDGEPECVERAEYFQNCFLTEDATIRLLREEIKEQEVLLENGVSCNPGLLEKAVNNQKRLRDTMVKAEKIFCALKAEFNNFLETAL